MSTKIIKKYFKEERDKLYIHLPILHRQVASNIIYDEELNIFVDSSEEINNILRMKAYLSECSKECLKKYIKYNNYKITNMFKRIMKNKLPKEIILEVIKYI